MEIHIGSGRGVGPTKLAAFDAALNDAGIANYNLLILSSVVPTGAHIIEHDGHINVAMPGGWGDRLYVVMARNSVSEPGQQAWAGIGWVQDAKTGKGLFVEHAGDTEQSVREDITQSLKALTKTRNMDLGPIHMKVEGVECADAPASVIVTAVYQASDWQNHATLFNGGLSQ